MKTTTRLLIGVALPVIIIDQLIKLLVSSALPLGGVWSPLSGPNPFFQIVYTINTGVAFGLFKDLGPVFIIIPLVISGVIFLYAGRLRADQRLVVAALGLMAGGALGNVIDRLRLGGGVLDFFDMGIGTLRNASNFADWSIVLGVILLAIAMWREERQSKLNSDVRSN
ncbi:MAG TPA: signal peptidase II [Anaerolineae bacterium]|nr:signal peptidase II [Anaerolineae bacterium]